MNRTHDFPPVSLPFLPGNSLVDPTKKRFHLSQSLVYDKGYALKNQPQFKIGGGKVELSKIEPAEIQCLDKEFASLQFSDVGRCEDPGFIPAHVALDKKVLHFKGYFTEEIIDSPVESERVRYLDIFYYLVDDSVAMSEPQQENSGITQGKFLTRQRLPLGQGDRLLSWKNLNTAMDLIVYSKKVRLYWCDAFTREWLTSEGIEVNSNEASPGDRYIVSRNQPERNYVSPSEVDSLHKFLTLDRVVLRFYATWDERDQLYGEVRKFIVHFYMADDTLEIREVHQANNGRDPFPILVSRQRMPKHLVPKTYPSVEKDIVSESVGFFEASDLKVGEIIVANNRKMLLYDCDGATRQFLQARLGVTQPEAVNIEDIFKVNDPPVVQVPEWNGFGSLEDSEENCKRIVPDRPRKNYLKMLLAGNEKLRFKAKMIGRNEMDDDRNFVFEIRLSDDLISIYETTPKNSGMRSGRFLEPSRIAKPASDRNYPEYYSIPDFCIGAELTVFANRFVITEADLHVKNWVAENATSLPSSFVQNIQAS
ncbi:unnamed protein product [Oikopleura dioica]|uniref:DM10 domain-containing protein n=1 Tax=Oikopleura dioica TaxID=34765 RepID=E4YDJ7_OIKDI|nr:unnamed protein product [Oikopleura dioica]